MGNICCAELNRRVETMKFTPTGLPGVILVEPDVWRDDRGFFLENYHLRKYEEGGIPSVFVQDNHSLSVRGTLRGLHAQGGKHPQGKLVRATEGEIFDVAVDIRVGSPTFKHWYGACLSAANFQLLYIPPGFAHGFCVLSEKAQVQYKCTDFYVPADEITIRWNDPAIGLTWPFDEPLLSEKDRKAPSLEELLEQLPVY
jgi:dTDP-4-dehydrorhamnose 3,5-epimerase